MKVEVLNNLKKQAVSHHKYPDMPLCSTNTKKKSVGGLIGLNTKIMETMQ